MCEEKNVKKTKRFRDNKRLTESETLIYSIIQPQIPSPQKQNDIK